MPLHRALTSTVFNWPFPAVAGGIAALVIAASGEPDRAMSIGLTGAAASIALAWGELRRAAAENLDLRTHLEHAMNHDGFRDTETSLGTLAALRIDWARQIARLQRRGERFSVALFDLHELGETAPPPPALMRAGGQALRSIARTEDTLYRLSPERIAVLLPGSDFPGAVAFIERARAALCPLPMDGSSAPLEISFDADIVDWREGVDSFPEARIMFDADGAAASDKIFLRFSAQRPSREEAEVAEAA
ncbi:MAG: GGDEF domain-containing protein [Dehalococcoidia bacterium]